MFPLFDKKNLTQSCSSITHCQNCTASGCIWCGDEYGCHAQFSPYGCVTAVPCNDILNCMRKTPQQLTYKDYAHVNIIVVIITIIVTSIIITVLWILLHYFIDYRRRKIMSHHHRKIDVQLDRYINDQHVPLYGTNERLSNIIHFDSSNHNTISNSIASIRRLTQYRLPASLRDIRKDKLVKCSCRFTSCLSFIIIMLSFIIILLFPTTPEYHICNSAKDWNDIWSSLIHGSVQTNYDFLFTIKNNNYFSIELTDISARVYYENAMIGYWYPDTLSVYIPSHSLVDILADVTLNPGVSNIYSIYNQYQANNLHLDIEFIGNTRTYFLYKSNDIKVLDMHLNLDKKNFVIGATMPTDRTDCNCPEQQK